MRNLTFLTVIFVLAGSITLQADEPVGPAYAAQKAAELKKLQAQKRPSLTGPAYAAARQNWLRGVQRENAKYRGTAPVGPAYAAATQRIKANQRLRNGTWSNNTYWFSRSTVRIKGPYQSTPAFRGLNDPYVWGSQANSFWRY